MMKVLLLLTALLSCLPSFGETNSRRAVSRYQLGTSSVFAQVSTSNAPEISFIAAPDQELMKLNFALILYEETGSAYQPTFGRSVVNQLVRTRTSTATPDWMELEVICEYNGESTAGIRNFLLDYSIFISKKWPIALLRINTLNSTDQNGARLEAYNWLFDLPAGAKQITSLPHGMKIVQNRYDNYIFSIDGRSFFRQRGQDGIEATVLPPQTFYLEPKELWEGFGPYFCLVFQSEAAADQEALQEMAESFAEKVGR
ncbi:hypothetical protein [Victivallis sp. Marseille-Q1083]|uniref:hypothetical protein n=1 Tax=Victivallis sp. Marseille-Q1083 TaxID=2717288 RepID=UPI001588D562|nr:hypothetical protein [Victivallis sp. Marseille-Q1083]